MLAYAGRVDVDVWYAETGCSSVSNGAIVAGSGDLATVIAAVEH